MSTTVTRYRFTVRQFLQLAEVGILLEDDPFELLQGDLVEMSPISARDAACVMRMSAIFVSRYVDKKIVSVRNPLQLDEHCLPQPDVALLRYKANYYADAMPTAQDAELVVEVSDGSLQFDSSIKLPLYAMAGASEVWLVDVQGKTVWVYSQPSQGEYRAVSQFHKGQRIKSGVVRRPFVAVDDLIGSGPLPLSPI